MPALFYNEIHAAGGAYALLLLALVNAMAVAAVLARSPASSFLRLSVVLLAVLGLHAFALGLTGLVDSPAEVRFWDAATSVVVFLPAIGLHYAIRWCGLPAPPRRARHLLLPLVYSGSTLLAVLLFASLYVPAVSPPVVVEQAVLAWSLALTVLIAALVLRHYGPFARRTAGVARRQWIVTGLLVPPMALALAMAMPAFRPYLAVFVQAAGLVPLFVGTLRRRSTAPFSPATSGHKIFNAVSEPLWIVDLSGHIRSANRALCDIFGCSLAELAGQEVSALVGLEGREADTLIEETLREGFLSNGEASFLLPDGETRFILLSATLLRGPDGGDEVTGLLFSARDITERRLALERFKRSEANLSALIENTGDAICSLDRQGRLSIFNAAFARFCRDQSGRNPQVGDRAAECLPRVLRAELGPWVERALRGEHYSTTKTVREGGRLFARELSFNPIRERDGEIKGVVLFLRDVSERIRHEEELRRTQADTKRLAMVAARINNGVLITDREGRVEWINRAFTRLAGYTLEEMKGRRPGELLQGPDTSVETTTYIRECMRQKRSWVCEILNYHKSGRRYWVHIDAQALFDGEGNHTGHLAIQTDVTEKKQYEMALRQAKERAEAATQAKSAFLANMSHEIRTPMNVVLGMANLLRETELDNTQAEYLELIRTSGETLFTLIEDILDLSKIEAGRMELERVPFNLRDTVEETLHLAAARAGDKPIELLCEIDPEVPAEVEGDPNRLRQILLNLTTNAAKFTEKGEIALCVRPHRQAGGSSRLHFTVRDTGIGIEKEHLEQLFQPFHQGDSSTTRRYGGSGLGLAICRRLCHMMGGEIWAESVPGEGSSFHFTVRLARAASPVEGPVTGGLPEGALQDRQALVFTSHEGLREQLRTVLGRAGASLLPLEDIDEEVRPDLAVIDLGGEIPPALAFARLLAEREEPPALVYLQPFHSHGMPSEDFPRGTFVRKPLRENVFLLALQDLRRGALRPARPPTRARVPASIPPARPQVLSRNDASGSAAERFLVVEDKAANQRVLLTMLERMGHEADVASNGQEAVERCLAGRYRMVLMDLQMPVMDGFEATAVLRERLGKEAPLVVAVTANVTTSDRTRCQEVGMCGFVAKPIRQDELRRVLEECAGECRNGGTVDGELFDGRQASR